MKKPTIDVDKQKKDGKSRWKFLSRFTITGQDGEPYLERLTIVQTPLFAVMMHSFLRSDADRCLHDHPWPFISIILSGGYIEETELGVRYFEQGDILFRPAWWRHRIMLGREEDGSTAPAKSLVIRGTKRREWGFWTRDGFRHWEDYLEAKNKGEVQC